MLHKTPESELLLKTNLFPPNPTAHGGTIRLGKRKVARPIATKSPMHLVFKSLRARGSWSFLHRSNKGLIHLTLLDCAKKYDVKVLGYENVGNHMHLVVQVRSRSSLQKFLRVFPQRVMFLVTGACKRSPKGKFFETSVFSRVVRWGKDYTGVKTYLWKNALEALGLGRENAKYWCSV